MVVVGLSDGPRLGIFMARLVAMARVGTALLTGAEALSSPKFRSRGPSPVQGSCGWHS
jgi:hypothetical protein